MTNSEAVKRYKKRHRERVRAQARRHYAGDAAFRARVKTKNIKCRARRGATWIAWMSMRARCSNPHRLDFKYYGGRGISVCVRWALYQNFLIDMGTKPSGLSLERIDNDGNYEPANCRWATMKEQAANRRHPKLIQRSKSLSWTARIQKAIKHGGFAEYEKMLAGDWSACEIAERGVRFSDEPLSVSNETAKVLFRLGVLFAQAVRSDSPRAARRIANQIDAVPL